MQSETKLGFHSEVYTIRHDFPFDPTYGYDYEALLRVPAPTPPDDFEAFWRGMYARARETAVKPTWRRTDAGNDEVDVYDVEYTSLGGVRIGGWAIVPRNEPVERGFVVGHGYGGREQPDLSLPVPRAAAIFPCARGMSRSRLAGVPDQSGGHVVHGIESRETYIHGGCAADVWCAATALVELLPEAGRRLDYIGGSFGGGIGALAMAWEERFTSGHLSVPSFGNHPLRLTLPCVGSGESVRQYSLRHPEVIDVLRYFDAATAATFIRVPTLVDAALFDPAVPPPGQFAVYNAISAPKELFVTLTGHYESPLGEDEWRRLREAQTAFFD